MEMQDASRHTYARITSHIATSHATHSNESRRTSKRVTSHIATSHITHTTSHRRLSHVASNGNAGRERSFDADRANQPGRADVTGN